jgi:CRISPR system Cascade subunit CasD
MDVLLLRFDAPLMSFGRAVIDQYGVIQAFPPLSLMTGLIANGLGYHHREAERLQALQQRIQYAVRQDRAGERLMDYHTVDLGQDHLLEDRAWTTHHQTEGRAGAASTGTHIRYREYWAGAIYTIALALLPESNSPSLDDVEQALKWPARPLFIGRKNCLPASPVLLGRDSNAMDLLDALRRAPVPPGVESRPAMMAWWPTTPAAEQGVEKGPYSDARDWKNQIHVGQRWVATGLLKMPMEEQG